MFNAFFSSSATCAVVAAVFHLYACTAADGFSEADTPGAARTATDENQVCLVDVYFVPGCDECRLVEERVLPELSARFPGRVRIEKHNLFDAREYAAAQERLDAAGVRGEHSVFCLVNRAVYIGGGAQISAELAPVVEEWLHKARGPGADSSAPVQCGGAVHGTGAGEVSGKSAAFPELSRLAFVWAGLADGLNPCSFAAIIFLVSLLVSGDRTRAGIALAGAGFCLAAYLTYFAIGLGLFQAFRMSLARLWLSLALRWMMAALLLAMAGLSLRDAWRFSLSSDSRAVLLKLPGRLNLLVHRVIRANLPGRRPFAGGMLLGFAVTVLESVCTGQIYLPVLAFMARAAQFSPQALGLLAIYNFLFVLPLAVVFLLAWRGAGSYTLLAWGRRNVVWGKCAMGIAFVVLAALLVAV